MLLSIIIPIYNAASYLGRCLDSLTEQKYDRMEIIVIDDFSTDNSLQIIEEYQQKDHRIKTFRNVRNYRVGYTRNRGLKEATGEYIWFIDADDWISLEAISDLVICLNTSSENVDLLVFGHTEHYGRDNNELSKRLRLPRNLDTGENALVNFLNLTKGFFSYPFLYLYSRELLLKHDILFPENVYYEDILFVAKAVHYAKNIKALPKSLYYYNCEKHDSITQMYSKEKIMNIISVYDKLYEFLENNKLIEKYNDPFLMRFILHGLGTCFQIYQYLNEEDKKDDELRQLLQSYLVSDILSERNMVYISGLIEEIDNEDMVAKQYHRLKLDVLYHSKSNWVQS